MSEESDGTHGGFNRIHRNRNRNLPRSKFIGKNEVLKDHVYDVVSGRHTFLETTRAIANYVGSHFDKADEFCRGMVELQLPVLTKPPDPVDDKATTVKKWEHSYRQYQDALNSRKNNQGKIYALTLGQCSPAIPNLMETSKQWEEIDTT